MTLSSARLILALALVAIVPGADADAWRYGGHAKYQFTASHFPANNLFAISGVETPLDHYVDVRLNAERKQGSWSYQVHYELLGLYGDTASVLASLPSLPSLSSAPTDDRRLLNLTLPFSSGNRLLGVHRIDRLVASYAKDKLALRIGRQAISWGNGLVFNPMDLVNPFSPTAISKEYKTGDDMLYAQWLLESGNDIQGVVLPRRDAAGDINPAESSYAAKYRGDRGALGYDVLLAQHYDEKVTALGFTTDFKGAVVRADIVNTALATGGNSLSSILNASYSWTWGKHNVSGNLEYYRNGVGNAAGDYTDAFIGTSPLGKRVLRGEVFALGRDYLAASLAIEMTPRLVMTPTWIHNLNDSSGILQTLFNYDWKPDMPLVAGLALPYGSLGSEFGGIDTGTPGQYYGPGKSVFLQLGVYF